LVVLGTGTEIGKTFVTAALARALRAHGCSVLALKPIETGCSGSLEPPAGSDAEQLEEASTRGLVRPHPLHAFPEPISPHLAALRAGVSIDTPWTRRSR
jgi:dethiobiotin synthetase